MTPVEAWRVLLEADAKVRAAHGTAAVVFAERVAAKALTDFVDAVRAVNARTA